MKNDRISRKALAAVPQPSTNLETGANAQTADQDCVTPEMVAIYQSKTPTERLQIAFGMWRSARKIIAAAVRHQHPDWTEEQCQAEVARRMSDGTS